MRKSFKVTRKSHTTSANGVTRHHSDCFVGDYSFCIDAWEKVKVEAMNDADFQVDHETKRKFSINYYINGKFYALVSNGFASVYSEDRALRVHYDAKQLVDTNYGQIPA